GVRVDVEVPADLTVSMDAGKVQQALLNLVKNAIEASPPEESVILRAVPEEKGTVRDSRRPSSAPSHSTMARRSERSIRFA
ncbi:MAG TPA: hypothetical protein VGR93_03610, partial [Candidatus Acidoferrales bacterium]|nr:hypothetical protein [Candidatus Acidoferrales bacterium]